MGQNHPLDLTIEDHFQETFQALLPVVHARAKVLGQLVAPSFPGAVRLQILRLAFEIVFLVVTRNPE